MSNEKVRQNPNSHEGPFEVGKFYYQLLQPKINGRSLPHVSTWIYKGMVRPKCQESCSNSSLCLQFRQYSGDSESEGRVVQCPDVEIARKIFQPWNDFLTSCASYRPPSHITQVKEELGWHSQVDKKKMLAIIGPENDARLLALSATSEIESIYVYFRLSDKEIDSIARARRLKKLYLEKVELSQYLIDVIASLGRIDSLYLRNCTNGAGAFSQLRLPAHLTELSLTGTNVENEVMSVIAKSDALRSLHLGRTFVTGSGLIHLIALAKLTQLSLNSTRIFDDDMEDLIQLSNLRQLNLSNTAITDRAVEVLSSLEIESLCISHTDCTEQALRILEDVPTLKYLSAQGLSLSFRAVRCLQEANPECYIVH